MIWSTKTVILGTGINPNAYYDIDKVLITSYQNSAVRAVQYVPSCKKPNKNSVTVGYGNGWAYGKMATLDYSGDSLKVYPPEV